jgi:diaminohydroxyphosphoribosylaminopyrimidine deaminase / 5-amino-6-(5-phosphoribosylamino)uracil reductase
VTKTERTAIDVEHMAAALSLAARNLGQVWPNPAVGCVVVDAAGRVVGRGFTQPGGRPHAETEALAMAGERARGGTAFVTLEPCAHHGKTPPCAEALIAAGIARCIAAIEDPDPRVSGRGLAMLRQAGIAVETGPLADQARTLNAGFLTRVTAGRPFVALKLATSLDGCIATRAGESRWITGEAARAFGHRLRATHDAIAVGSGTVLADDPELTCRLAGLEHRSPVRLVFDRRGRVPARAKVMT